MINKPPILSENEFPERLKETLRNKDIFCFRYFGFNPPLALTTLAFMQENNCLPRMKYIIAGGIIQLQIAILLSYSEKKNLRKMYEQIIKEYLPYDITNFHYYQLISLLMRG